MKKRIVEKIIRNYEREISAVLGNWTNSKKGKRSPQCPLQEVKE